MSDLSRKVSILIPTIDRSLFMIRALHFYSSVGFNGHVCIGDSSGPIEFQRTQEVVQKLSEKLKIVHRHYPTSDFPNEATVVKSLITLAPTKYVCQYGDDDFLIPSGVSECVGFLDKNEDYVGACGKSRIEFTLKKSSLYFGQITETVKVDENDFDKVNAKDRFTTYMRNAVAPTYNIYRKTIFENMYRRTDVALTRYFGPEVLVSAIAALSGKAKSLNVFTVMFQVHDQHVFGWYKQSIYDTIVDPTFSRSVSILREEFVKGLKKHDGLSSEAALKVVDRELWEHITRMLSWQFKEKHFSENADPNSSFWVRLKRLPGIGAPINVSLISCYWWMRKVLRHWIRKQNSKSYSVNSLGSVDSIYREEFSLVSRFLLAPPTELTNYYSEIQRIET